MGIFLIIVIVYWIAMILMFIGWTVNSRQNNPYWENCCKSSLTVEQPEVVVQTERTVELPVVLDPEPIKYEDLKIESVLPSYEDILKDETEEPKK